MAKLTMILGVQKTTDNTIVWQEVKDPNDPFSVRRVSGFYLNNRDAKELGLSKDSPRVKMTLEAIPVEGK